MKADKLKQTKPSFSLPEENSVLILNLAFGLTLMCMRTHPKQVPDRFFITIRATRQLCFVPGVQKTPDKLSTKEKIMPSPRTFYMITGSKH